MKIFNRIILLACIYLISYWFPINSWKLWLLILFIFVIAVGNYIEGIKKNE